MKLILYKSVYLYFSHVLWHKRKTPQIKTDLLGLLKENKTRAVCRCHWRLQDASTIESPAGFTQQSAVRENNALKINKTKYKFCSNIFKNKSKLLQEYYSEAEDRVCWDWVSLHVLSGLGVRGLTFKKTKALIRIRAIKLFLSVYFSLFCLEDAPQPVCLLCCVYYSAAWRDEVFGAPTLTEALSRFSLRSQVMNVRLIRRNME